MSPDEDRSAYRARRRRYFDDLYGFFTDAVQLDAARLTLLDFGAGRDGYVKFYREHFGKCIAVDINSEYARGYDDGDIEFVLAEDHRLPIADASVDVVVSHSAFEHVRDITISLGEINRVLRRGGWAYITVSGLFFSPSGGHLRIPDAAPARLDNWEHLDPSGPHYQGIDGSEPYTNARGQHLNKLTTSRFLAAVGQQPWDIIRYEISPQRKKLLPPFLIETDINRVDFFVRTLMLVARKVFDVVDDQVEMG